MYKIKHGFYQKYVKRLFDIVLCSLALIILSPIYLIVVIGIKVSSPGTVLYYSDRAGLNGKPFHFYKFRSMHQTDNDKKMFVADQDRVFPFGKVMRRLKLDELPQLINVIKGDMSIVGPRPMTVKGVEKIYAGKYEPVKLVRPGLTSIASIYDYIVGDTYTDNDEYIRVVLPVKKELELLYVHKLSFGYDALLVGRTIVAIIQVAFGKKDFKEMKELSEIDPEIRRLTVR